MARRKKFTPTNFDNPHQDALGVPLKEGDYVRDILGDAPGRGVIKGIDETPRGTRWMVYWFDLRSGGGGWHSWGLVKVGEYKGSKR